MKKITLALLMLISVGTFAQNEDIDSLLTAMMVDAQATNDSLMVGYNEYVQWAKDRDPRCIDHEATAEAIRELNWIRQNPLAYFKQTGIRTRFLPEPPAIVDERLMKIAELRAMGLADGRVFINSHSWKNCHRGIQDDQAEYMNSVGINYTGECLGGKELTGLMEEIYHMNNMFDAHRIGIAVLNTGRLVFISLD